MGDEPHTRPRRTTRIQGERRHRAAGDQGRRKASCDHGERTQNLARSRRSLCHDDENLSRRELSGVYRV
ncbi:hypothetical protein VPHK225_0055 [Vibrio phage K225]